MEAEPDITLQELGKKYIGRKKEKALSEPVVFRALKKLGFRRKKKSTYCIEQDRPDIKK